MDRWHKNFSARVMSALSYPAVGLLLLMILAVSVGAWALGTLLIPFAVVKEIDQ